jgi:5-methylcytosine-specific restriction enzyme subunit McrC
VTRLKIRVDNLFYLFSYAWNLFSERQQISVSAIAASTPVDMFVRVLLNATKHLLLQRLDRGYVELEDELSRPRGKILVTRTLTRAVAHQSKLACRFDDCSDDVLHNQILKATLRLATYAQELNSNLRSEVLGTLRALSSVSDTSLSLGKFRMIQWHANLRRYRLPLHICELLYRRLLPETKSGDLKFRSFAEDDQELPRIFEEFVRNFFRREQNVFPRVQKARMPWKSTGETNNMLPELHTDITLTRPQQTVIVELKCYEDPLAEAQYGVEKLRSAHLNQLHAYLSNNSDRTATKTGVLLYAVDRHRIAPLRFTLCGHDVVVRELNLNQHWQLIASDLLSIIATVTE